MLDFTIIYTQDEQTDMQLTWIILHTIKAIKYKQYGNKLETPLQTDLIPVILKQ